MIRSQRQCDGWTGNITNLTRPSCLTQANLTCIAYMTHLFVYVCSVLYVCGSSEKDSNDNMSNKDSKDEDIQADDNHQRGRDEEEASSEHITEFLELGPGKVLSSLVGQTTSAMKLNHVKCR